MRRRTVLGTGLAAVTASLLPRAAVAENAAAMILERLHTLRRENNLQRLRPSPGLTKMAQLQALHMHSLGHVTHDGPDGSDPPARGLQAGYGGRILGEALAETRAGPGATMDAWLAHGRTRAVLLDPGAREIGLYGMLDETQQVRWNLVIGARE